MRNKYAANHVLLRDGVFYYVRRVPLDLAEHYSVKRLCFSLRTKSYKSAIHASKSVSQRLEDYWLGLRLQKIDIPALDLVKADDEFDYGRIHPTILYADENIVLEEDAYDIGIEKEHRDIVKQSFNAMVQAETKLTSPPNDVDWKSTGRTWKQLRQLILDKHEPIKDSFFCGMGNKLQFKDSQLAEQIMLRFAKQDIPVLPVHDSFIIIRRLYSELVNAMHEEFEKIFHVPIKIDDSAKASLVSFTPEDVDVDWIISETDEYGSWTDRNPL